MAFRIAELMVKAESAEGEERDKARAECTDLILRLWSIREEWPSGPPLGKIVESLEALGGKSRNHWSKEEPKDLPGLIKRLDDLAERELDMVRDVFVSRIDLTAEREWVSEQGRNLSEEEVKIFDWINDRQESLQRNINFDRDERPNLMEIDDLERVEWLRNALELIAGKRQNAIDSVTLEGESESVEEEGDDEI